jgi:hypothetical protein
MAGELSHLPPQIDYHKLSAGLNHYESLGYPYMEVPWVVSREAIAVTLPENATATSVQYGDLVGSGEQSFIELMLRGQAVLKACCITPCFRIEDRYDDLHHPYFMKLELINTDATTKNLRQMILDARGFFQKYTDVAIEQTGPDTYDIVDRDQGIELGSYGFREFNGRRFIYGTGLALPRLDMARSVI